MHPLWGGEQVREVLCTRCGKGGRLGSCFALLWGGGQVREVLCTRYGKGGRLGRYFAPAVGRGTG